MRFLDRQGDVYLRHGEIMGVGVSGNGRFAASGGAAGTAAAWDLTAERPLVWINTPHVNVYTVAISDDGARLATSGWDGTTRMWDVASGQQRWTSKLDADRLWFTADGKHLIGGRFHLYRVWTEDGRLVREDVPPQGDIQPTRGFAISGDATRALALTPIGGREVWSGDYSYFAPSGFAAEAYDVVHQRPGLRFWVGDAGTTAIEVAPKGDRIAVLGSEHLDVFFIDGTPIAHVRVAGDHGALLPHTRMLLATDPRYAVTWDDDELAGWDLAANRELWRVHDRSHDGPRFQEPQLAGGDVLILSAGVHCAARDIATGKQLWRRDHCGHARALPSTATVVFHRGSTLDAVDARTGTSQVHRPAPIGPLASIAQLAASPDGTRVAGIAGPELWTWEATGSRRLVDPSPQTLSPALMFLASGRLVVAPEQGATLFHRYDVERNAIEATRDARSGEQIGGPGVFFGERIIFAGVRDHDDPFTMLDLADREPPRKLPLWRRPPNRPHMEMRNESPYSAVADPVAQRMFVIGERNHVHAWDLRSGRLVARSAESNDVTARLVLTPDRRHVIVPRDKGPIIVLDAATLRERRRLDGPQRGVAMAAVSPDSALVAAVALDGLYVWRLADGARVATVDLAPAHEVPTSIAFAADGNTLWVGTDLGTMLRFSVAP